MRGSLMIIPAAIALVMPACTPPRAEQEDERTAPTVTVTLPPGDSAAGRQAFQDLRCTACHAVPSEPDFPTPISANPGPPLDRRLANQDVSYLLASILTPSHALSMDMSDAVRDRLEGTLSPMGDFSHVMTVRQLVDVHAFVVSLQ
jgi:hypothetical protein